MNGAGVQTSAPPVGYDLDAHDPKPKAEAGVEMTLLDPRRRPTGVVLRVRGMDSDSYTAMLEGQQRRRNALAPRKLTEEEADAEFYELQASLVAGWPSGVFKRNGEPFDYTPANAAALLKQYPYILEQVIVFARERANFLPGSASS